MSVYCLSVFSSLAVICAVLWRLAMCQRPRAGTQRHVAWALYGATHIALLLSVAVRAVRLLGGEQPLPLNTAIFYLLVAVILFYPTRARL